MRLVTLVILLLLFSAPIYGQIFPYNKSGRWGVVTKSKEVIVPAEFSDIFVCKGNGSSLILAHGDDNLSIFDTTGKLLKKLRYPLDSLQMRVGLEYKCAPVTYLTINGRKAFIVMYPRTKEIVDMQGNVLLKAGIYDDIKLAGNLLEVRKDNLYGLLDTTLRTILPVENRSIWCQPNWVLAYGKSSYPLVLNRRTLQRLPCSLITGRLIMHNNDYDYFQYTSKGLLGVMDTNCQIIVPAKYKNLSVNGELIVAELGKKKSHVYTLGGKLLLQEPVVSNALYSNGLYVLFTEKEAVFFSRDFKEAFRSKGYSYVSPVWYFKKAANDSNWHFATRKNREVGVIDEKNNLIYTFTKNRYVAVFENYAVEARLRLGELLFLKEKERDTVRLVYRNGTRKEIVVQGTVYGLPVDNRLAVMRNNKIGFVDFDGKEVIPFIFDRDQSMMTYSTQKGDRLVFFQNGMARPIYKGKRVTIDTSGAINTDIALQEMYVHQLFPNGNKLVTLREERERNKAIVDKDGKILRREEDIHVLQNGLLVIAKGYKKALFDADFKQLTDYVYDQIWFDTSINQLYVMKDRKEGFMSLDLVEYFE